MNLFSLVLDYPRATLVAVVTVAGATLAAYMREQTREAVLWYLKPLTQHLPWNEATDSSLRTTALSSELSIVDLFLADGKRSRYRKTSAYTVNSPLSSYREGVTASGYANRFTSAKGRISRTVNEHGFYMSEIDLGNLLSKGDSLLNVYEAKLYDSFCQDTEFWTQQISFETSHLIIQVHFPSNRPPVSHKTSVIVGTHETSAMVHAQMIELYGRKSLVWDISRPNSKLVYKITWSW
jgi:hypothetical protein